MRARNDSDILRKVWPSVALVVAVIVGFKVLNLISPWLIAIVLMALLAYSLRSWIR